jgi:two-component system NtrC family sensor kinase
MRKIKSFLKTFFLLFIPALSFGQKFPFYQHPTKSQYDSLKKVLNRTVNDTMRMALYREFGYYFNETSSDSCLYYTNLQLTLARKLGLKLWEADALDDAGYVSGHLGNYPGALQILLQAIKIAEDPASEKNIWNIAKFTTKKDPRSARLTVLGELTLDLSGIYHRTRYKEKELEYLIKAEKIGKENNDGALLTQFYGRLGEYYAVYDQPDSAVLYLQKSVAFAEQVDYRLYEGETLSSLGKAYIRKGNYVLAKSIFFRAIRASNQQNNITALTMIYLSLADLYRNQNGNDWSIYYAKKALSLSKITNELADQVYAYSILSSVFKLRKNIDSAYKYQSLAFTAQDSLGNAEKVKKFENIGFAEQLRLQQLEEEKAANQVRIRTYSMLAALGVFLLIAVILYRNNRQKHIANKTLEKTLNELKSTQTQLVQREKMASLGELTAGIAHEIQNPLNFVNNFSEVNREMLEELKAESQKPKAKRDELLEIELINDLIDNEEKINHHGKRAEHSRAGTGQKQPTDLNALCADFLKLSCSGFLAKDKDFNTEIITNFDADLPKVNIVQQDIGRVLVNLFNNAFYAVNEKSKTAGTTYKPIVGLTTFAPPLAGGGRGAVAVVIVRDNGNGIPEAIKDKIMQPFFTTKPTGEGTGLGLSLSYDIVVKGHSGSINVDSKEGGFTEFSIQLPI